MKFLHAFVCLLWQPATFKNTDAEHNNQPQIKFNIQFILYMYYYTYFLHFMFLFIITYFLTSKKDSWFKRETKHQDKDAARILNTLLPPL